MTSLSSDSNTLEVDTSKLIFNTFLKFEIHIIKAYWIRIHTENMWIDRSRYKLCLIFFQSKQNLNRFRKPPWSLEQLSFNKNGGQQKKNSKTFSTLKKWVTLKILKSLIWINFFTGLVQDVVGRILSIAKHLLLELHSRKTSPF